MSLKTWKIEVYPVTARACRKLRNRSRKAVRFGMSARASNVKVVDDNATANSTTVKKVLE